MAKSSSPRSVRSARANHQPALPGPNGETPPARVKPKRAPVFVPDPKHVTDTSLSRARCAFPLWDDDARRPDQRFCGTPIERGRKPYCGYHTVVAHFGRRHADAIAQGLPVPAIEPEIEPEPIKDRAA